MSPSPKKSTASGKVRIIGGAWRGRKLTVLDKPGLRPTTDRVRETLFNWLQWQIHDSRCLDLFAGTGVLGIEAFSRGARAVTLVEQDGEIATALAIQLAHLPPHHIELIQQNAVDFLTHTPPQPFDLVFLDPPFAAALLEPCCQLLEHNGWLQEHAQIYVEFDSQTHATLPKNWHPTHDKTAGQVRYQLLVRENLNSNIETISL
jgi:16S rRNA (guanine966-N2)-methyltransferase